jgi:type 1 glutamine amidotransferase
MVMAHEYGKGHVVVNTLGHDVKAMKTPETRIIIARSVEWAATGKVNQPK